MQGLLCSTFYLKIMPREHPFQRRWFSLPFLPAQCPSGGDANKYPESIHPSRSPLPSRLSHHHLSPSLLPLSPD